LERCCGGLFATTSTARSKRAHASGSNSTPCFFRLGFAMSDSSDYRQSKAIYDAPPAINRELGRIVMRCGYIENTLQRIVWRLMQITTPVGQIGTRAPRAEQRLDMIRDLAVIRKIKLDEKLISSIKSDLRQIFERRDVLAHGNWTKTPEGQLAVIQISGNWPEQDAWPVRSRRILPEALLADLTQLRTIVTVAEQVIEKIHMLSRSIDLPAPPEEHPEQFAHTDRPKGRKPSKPRRRG
jgi:hypothetical protein